MYDSLKDDSITKLYSGCSGFTHLLGLLRLSNTKARNGWTNKNFTELLELLHEILLEGNTLWTNHYKAKKILCLMSMEY